LNANTSGNDNTANGANALFSNTTGYRNTAIGTNALFNNTSGFGNTAIGNETLHKNIDGFHNTAIGYMAGASNPGIREEFFTNCTAIGYNAQVDASNKVRIGDAFVTVIEGQVPFTTPSDGRFKTHVTETVKGLDFILKLRPVVYNFEAGKYEQFKNGGASFAKSEKSNYQNIEELRQSGFIAQEVEKAAKEVNYDFNGVIIPKTAKETYGLSYSQFVVPLVKAVQEQQQQIKEQQEQIDRLVKENEELKKLQQQVEALSKALQALSANK
jgi:hypothetical protein